MNFTIHSHCGGNQAFSIEVKNEIEAGIQELVFKPAKGVASKLRTNFLTHLKGSGWTSEVSVSINSDITITSLKGNVGLCLQTGNFARIYADLIKLQTMYLDNAIKAAAIVLPSQPIAALLGSNIAQATRLERELVIFKKVYNVPTLIYAIE